MQRSIYSGPARVEELADILYASGHDALVDERRNEALNHFSRLTQVCPRDERGWLGVGACMEQAGDNQRACVAYSFGSVLAPSLFCHLGQARTLAKLGRRREAERALDAAELLAEGTAQVALVEEVRGGL